MWRIFTAKTLDEKTRLLSKFLMALIVIGFAVGPLNEWLKNRAIEQEIQEKKLIGIQASIVGALAWGAYKNCLLIGIQAINECAVNTGILAQEQSAATMAKTAQEQAQFFHEKCQKHFRPGYCIDLVNRAIGVSRASSE